MGYHGSGQYYVHEVNETDGNIRKEKQSICRLAYWVLQTLEWFDGISRACPT